MDGSRFDTLTRAIAQSGTRRRVVAFLATLPLSGYLTDLAGDDAAAERPTDRVRGRNAQRHRKQRNKNGKNNKSRGSGNQNPGHKRCKSDADCKGRTCCRGTCCKPPANQCNLEGLCCAPNCAGRTCGPDGCGQGKTCGSCGVCQTCNAAQGTCEPVANGTVCGTSSHGGTTLRCCNGACPDPDCVPVGVEMEGCPGPCGQDGSNCCSFPGEGGGGFCLGSPPDRCYCTIFDFPGMRCGSDNECSYNTQGLTACICGTCQAPPS